MSLLDPYIKAKYTPYWEFPTAIERGAATVIDSELGRVAWQIDDNTVWMLIGLGPDWLALTPSKGIATLNFGAIGSVGNLASVVVPAPNIKTTSLIQAALRLEATAEHSV